MHEQELERILEEIGREEFAPPPELAERTKRRIRRSRALPLVVLASLCMQLLTVAIAATVLCYSEIGWVAKAYALFGFSIFISVLLIPLAGVGPKLRVCLERLQESYAPV